MNLAPGTETVRFRRPTTDKKEEKPKPSIPKNTLLHEQIRKTHRPWIPSFSLALRILLLIRVAGAMYSNMDDCDEGEFEFTRYLVYLTLPLVYNFWEPLHLFINGYGFQTWELSPVFALRSWAYVLLHYLPARIGLIIGGGLDKVCRNYLRKRLSPHADQRISFFAVRLFLGVVSALVESAFYRSVVDNVNQRVGRYLFFMLVFSAGMWNSATGAYTTTVS